MLYLMPLILGFSKYFIDNMSARFLKKLYTGKRLRHKASIVKWKYRHGAGMPGVYFVTLIEDGPDLLEIYPVDTLMQAYYRKKSPLVVGMAEGYGEALEIVENILTDVHTKAGGYDTKEYFRALEGRPATEKPVGTDMAECPKGRGQ